MGLVYFPRCNKLTKPYFGIIVLLSIFGFSYLSTVSFLHIAVDASSIKYQWDWKTWAVIISAIIVVLMAVVWHIRLAFKIRDYSKSFCRMRYGFIYLITIFLTLSFYAICYAYLKLTKQDFQIHIHHWFIFWLLSLFARFNDTISIICQSICVGIFIQGTSSYGADSMMFQLD